MLTITWEILNSLFLFKNFRFREKMKELILFDNLALQFQRWINM